MKTYQLCLTADELSAIRDAMNAADSEGMVRNETTFRSAFEAVQSAHAEAQDDQ